ncbi:hypothetical protein [Novipirellula sp.]
MLNSHWVDVFQHIYRARLSIPGGFDTQEDVLSAAMLRRLQEIGADR